MTLRYLASAVSTLVKGKIASVATRHNQQHQHAFWTFPSSDFITLSQALDVGASTSDQADKGLSECRSGKGAKMRIEELILDGTISSMILLQFSGHLLTIIRFQVVSRADDHIGSVEPHSS